MNDMNLPDNTELEAVTEYLKKVKFKKKPLGGVDERDVWKKLDELNNLYKAALVAERARYNTLLKCIKESAEGKDNG